MSHSPWLAWAPLAFLLTAVCACEELADGTADGGADASLLADGSASAAESVSGEVGPQGAVLALRGFRLTIPPGALPEPTWLSVSLATLDDEGALPGPRLSPVFSLEPAALQLELAAAVELDVAVDGEVPVLGWVDARGVGHVVESQTADGTTAGEIDEFGHLVVVDARALAEDARFSGDPILVRLLREAAGEIADGGTGDERDGASPRDDGLDGGAGSVDQPRRDAGTTPIALEGDAAAAGGGQTPGLSVGLLRDASVGPCVPGQYLDPLTQAGCLDCPAGTFSTVLDATGCSPFTECGAGEVESAAPSSVADRACVESDSCPAGTFVAAPATAATNALCEPCEAGTFAAAENAEACVPWTACAPSEYELTPPTARADRVCTPASDCGPGQYRATPATAEADVVCARCDEGTFSAMANADACTPWRVCGPNQYEASAPSDTLDRLCAAVSQCEAGEYVAAAATATSNVSCSPCPAGTFSGSVNAATCTPHRECAEGQVESSPPSPTSDRVCTTANTCGPGQFVADVDSLGLPICQTCAAGTFSDVENAAQCTPHTVCIIAEEYESTPASASQDRVCSAVTNCPPGAYVAVDPTATSDRQCSACTDGFSVATNAATCEPWRDCPPGSVVTLEPSGAQDRQCGACPRGTQSVSVNATQCLPTNFMRLDGIDFPLQSGWMADSGETTIASETGERTYATRRLDFYDAATSLEPGDIYSRGIATQDGTSGWVTALYLPPGTTEWDGYLPVLNLLDPPAEFPEAFAFSYMVISGERRQGTYVAASGDLFFERIDGALAVSAVDVSVDGFIEDVGTLSFEGYYLFPEATPVYYATGPHLTTRGVKAGDPVFTAQPSSGASLWRYAYTGKDVWAVGPPPIRVPQAGFSVDVANGALSEFSIAYENRAPELDFAIGYLWGYAPGSTSLTVYNPETFEVMTTGQISSKYPPLRGFTNDGTAYRWIGLDPGCDGCRAFVTYGDTETPLTGFSYDLDDVVFGGGALWISAGRGNILKLGTDLTLLDVYHVVDFAQFGEAASQNAIVMHLEYIDGALWILDQANNFYRLAL